MTWGAIIAARMESKRFPGKVLADINGQPMIRHIVNRVAKANLGAVVVASPNPEVLDAVKGRALRYFVDDEEEKENVLLRLFRAASQLEMYKVVRVTGDCPLVDPGLVNVCLNAADHENDYTSNVIHRTFPGGLDTEIVHLDILARLNTLVTESRYKEHVTLYIRENLDKFVTTSVELEDGDYTCYDWRVDYPEDLELIRDIYRACGADCAWTDAVAYLGGRSAERLRIATRHGSTAGNHPAADAGDSKSTATGGPAWYERQPRVTATD